MLIRVESRSGAGGRGSLMLLLGLFVLLGASVAGSQTEGDALFEPPPEPIEEAAGPVGNLLEQLIELHPPDQFERCETSGAILLNEICAVGIECDPDVRIRDFVELYNPGGSPVDLACVAVSARDHVVFAPSGMLEPGAFRAFGELEMGYRIAKQRDFISLYRLGVDLDGNPKLTLSETVAIDETRAHAYRLPDGGVWFGYPLDEAEQSWPGSFGASNQPTEDEPAGVGEIVGEIDGEIGEEAGQEVGHDSDTLAADGELEEQ